MDHIFAAGSLPIGKTVESRRTKEMKETYVKHFKIDIQGTRNTSYRRNATFIDVSSDKTFASSKEIYSRSIVDNRFWFDEWRKTFKKFCRACFVQEMKAYLSVLALLNAIITKAIDSFKFILKT